MASYNDRDRETRTTLYVAGFHPQTRAYDLAEVFERQVPVPTPPGWHRGQGKLTQTFNRCGKLVRCDIPASRNLCNQSIGESTVPSLATFLPTDQASTIRHEPVETVP